MVMFSPSATFLLNTRSPLLLSVKPSRRPRRSTERRSATRSLEKRRPAALVLAESGSDDDVDVTRAEPVDHRGNVFHPMLPVAVESRENLRPRLLAGVLDAGLDGRALAQVDGMAHQVSPARLAISPVPSVLPSSTQTTLSKTERTSAITSPMTVASLKAGTTIQTSG